MGTTATFTRGRNAIFGYLAIAAILAAAGCSGAIDQSAAGDVENGLERLRELSFTQKVPFVVKSTDEAQQMMLGKLMRDNSNDELRIGGETGVMTGLFPRGTDLKVEELKLMRQQVAGFYDPHDKVMVEVRGKSVLGSTLAGRSQFSTELLQAHELTHALQDQHFGLDRILNQVKHNDDEEIAIHSVIEGDATLAGLAYVSGGMTSEEEKNIVQHFATVPDNFEPEASGTPLALSIPLMFQYTQGTRFVAEAWERGGWAGVDALYHDPPRSSQEIMEPELYFDHRTTPLDIEVKGYQGPFAGWKKVDEDTFGELLLKIIFDRNLPTTSPALKIPATWRGDRMVALEKDGVLTLVWLLAFHDPAAAHEFALDYRSILDDQKGPRHQHWIEDRGNAVLVIIGPPSARFNELAAKVWQASAISSRSKPTVGVKTASSATLTAALTAHTTAPK
jgi:hypothetical protein